MQKIPIDVIITTYHEASTITALLGGLNKQTYSPNKIIIVDNYSKDNTLKKIRLFAQQNPQLTIQVCQRQANRSMGRNKAIELSQTKLQAITDAGCIPQPDWLAELVKSYLQTTTQSPMKEIVVAGYYQGLAKTAFEQAVVPYVLVMPDKINPQNFLPATRSMLLPKTVWKKLNGFNPQLSLNEDYDFARRLKNKQIKIVFTQQAIVGWLPRKNLVEFFKMIYSFAKGDAQAKLWRPKVGLIFARYLFGLILLWQLPQLVCWLLVIYGVWAILKNIRYVPQGWYYLPLLQINSDLAVMTGTVSGLLTK